MTHRLDRDIELPGDNTDNTRSEIDREIAKEFNGRVTETVDDIFMTIKRYEDDYLNNLCEDTLAVTQFAGI